MEASNSFKGLCIRFYNKVPNNIKQLNIVEVVMLAKLPVLAAASCDGLRRPMAGTCVNSEYKYCSHVQSILWDAHVSPVVAVPPSRLPVPSPPCAPRPLPAAPPSPDQPRPAPYRSQRFPRATSTADRRACCVGCLAKMIDSFINNS